jgi:Helix-turn-helix domain
MRKHRRRSDRSGRALLFSPGRPVVAGRDEQRRFWAAIAAGMASEDAALQAGMSQPVGSRLFRRAGGMPPAIFRPSAKPLSGRYLSFAEREEIALLRVQGCSMREVARRLGRAASTSRGSCGATPRHEAGAWSIARRQRSGMLSDLLAAQSRRSLRSTRRCEPMWRNDWQGSLSLRMGLLFLARLCAGKVAGMDRGSIGGGQTPGARSRLLAACRSTSRTMRQCASAMKPSIKRCSFKVVVRCAVS